MPQPVIRGPKDRHSDCAAPSVLYIATCESYPGLTAGPTQCRPFGPRRKCTISRRRRGGPSLRRNAFLGNPTRETKDFLPTTQEERISIRNSFIEPSE